MARHTHTIWIDCDPAALFGVLMDPAANRRWQTGVVATRSTCNGVAAVGATMSEVREVAGYRTTITYQLVELEWARRAVVSVIDGPLRGTASYTCRAARGGTVLTVASDVAPQGRWRYLSRAVGGLLTAELALSCQRLKTVVEQPSSTPIPSLAGVGV
jgi:hypothetical protein